jgi:hypothetical protein
MRKKRSDKLLKNIFAHAFPLMNGALHKLIENEPFNGLLIMLSPFQKHLPNQLLHAQNGHYE